MNHPNGIADITTIQESCEIARKISWDSLLLKFCNNLRTAKDLKKRWTGSLDPNLKKGKWTPEEDQLLTKAYEKHGPHWLSISMHIAGRTEDQCAKRYIEVLGPSSKGRLREWTIEEDLALISKVKKYGTKWRKISSEMEFRPSLTCRNRWRKIITLVVRGQALPEITEAVKENKDIDLSHIAGGQNSKKEDPDKVKNEHGQSTLFDIKKLPPITDLASTQGRFDNINQHHTSSSRTPITTSTDALATLAETVEKDFENNRVEENSETHVNQYSPKSELNTNTEMQWKFTLKDGQGLSISNGSIDNSELVKELIEQAKKYSLKISIHQHIHNHYGSQMDPTNNINTIKGNKSYPNLQQTGSLAFGNSGPTSHASFDNRISYDQMETGFLSKSPSYPGFRLEASPQPILSPHMYYSQQNHQQTLEARTSEMVGRDTTATTTTDPSNTPALLTAVNGSTTAAMNNTNMGNNNNDGITPSSTRSQSTPGSELPDVGPNRISHFNYLPPTLKPQLGSSETPRNADLSKLLNPSPSSNNGAVDGRRKRKKRRRNERTGTPGSSAYSSGTSNPGTFNSENIVSPGKSSHPSVPESSKRGSPSTIEEDGLDFWES